MHTQRRRLWITVAVGAVLSVLNLARADWTIQRESVHSGMTGRPIHQKTTFRVRANVVRIDVVQSTGIFSSIENTETGERVELMHYNKTYAKLSASQQKENREIVEKDLKDNPDLFPKDPPKAIATGKTDTINGFDVQEYATTNSIQTQSFWITKDVPHVEALRRALAKRARVGRLVDSDSLPGYSVRIESHTAAHTMKNANGSTYEISAMTTVDNLISIKEEPLEDSVFEIPADYKEMAEPARP